MNLILLFLFVIAIAEFVLSQRRRRLKAETRDATDIVPALELGWNIGNTLEAIGGETNWGNPTITKQLIVAAKEQGFKAIRLPCSWDQYIEDKKTSKLKASWLARVKEVVQWCIDSGFYVLINIHADGFWLEKHVTPESEAQVNLKQKQLWSQIASYFKNFDNHLLFGSANEPDVKDATGMKVLYKYHQTFIDVVRSSGGHNDQRILVVQAPFTNDISKSTSLMPKLPKDTVKNRLIVEVHYYAPYSFSFQTKDESFSKMAYYWGEGNLSPTDTSRNAETGESAIDKDMAILKTRYVNKGIQVIIGEFLAVRRQGNAYPGINLDLHKKSRLAFTQYLVRAAKKNKIIPFYWDAGDPGSALIDRKTYQVIDQDTINFMKKAANL